MRWVVTLVALCGCNQVFGIGESIQVDAQQFDTPRDAPFACPEPGTAPQFARLFHQVSTHNCIDYSFSAATNRAVASCTTSAESTRYVWEGTLDVDDLQPVAAFSERGLYATEPRLAPEGDEIYVRLTDNAGSKLSVYHRDAAGWTWQSDLAITLEPFEDLASVTRGPARRIFTIPRNSGLALREYLSDDAGGWREVGSYRADELGVGSVYNPRVTDDGLRMVFNGYSLVDNRNHMYYVARPDLTARFGIPVLLPDVPLTFGAALTSDCSRLYFSGFNTVFYVQQP